MCTVDFSFFPGTTITLQYARDRSLLQSHFSLVLTTVHCFHHVSSHLLTSHFSLILPTVYCDTCFFPGTTIIIHSTPAHFTLTPTRLFPGTTITLHSNTPYFLQWTLSFIANTNKTLQIT